MTHQRATRESSNGAKGAVIHVARDESADYRTDHASPLSWSRLRISGIKHPVTQAEKTWGIVAAVTVLVVAWLLIVFTADSVRFVIADSTAKTGLEVFLALGQLFAALVLLLAPVGPTAMRMRWVASGFFALGVGSLILGYFYPVLNETPHLSAIMYGSLYVRTCGVILIAIGMGAKVVPRLNVRQVVILTVLLSAVGIVIVVQADRLMPLVDVSRMASNAVGNASGESFELSRFQFVEIQQSVLKADSVFPGLTRWYWFLSLIPLGAAIVAVRGTMGQFSRGQVGAWLLVAVLLLAGTQLHSLFWPSLFSSLLTTTSVLRLGVALSVIVGGVYEFRQVVDQRARMLSEEQERVRQLRELSRLKADFSSMIVHEITSPLAAIARMSEMIGVGVLSVDEVATVSKRIESEARFVQLLVADVQATAEVERDDFQVRPRVVSVDSLLDEAEAYARSCDDTHPLHVKRLPGTQVFADPLRIGGQVLRNLLSNAMRHTEPGTLISLSASLSDGAVVFAVSDQGPGIRVEDQARIFEKFERGSATTRHNGRGHGLGLYLSRRIVRAHDSELRVDSTPGEFTRFWFTLEAVE